MRLSNDITGLLDRLDCFIELLLSDADLADDHQDLAVTLVLVAHYLFVHFVRFLKQGQSVFVVTCLHVAISEQSQNVGMVLLSGFNLCEEGTVQLEGGCQVIESLLEVRGAKVSLTELGVGCHQEEEVFAMHVDKQLAEGQLLDSDLDCALGVLARCVLVKLSIALN